MNVVNNDHFLLGLGLAAGPAIIIVFGVYAFFKWGKAWRSFMQTPEICGNPSFCLQHAGLIRDTSFTIDECKNIWLEIKDINNRQMTLRQKLPEDYVSKNDLSSIQDRLKSIDSKLDRYMELAVSSKYKNSE
jgi:hypothetical protein